ncbi:MAG: hypothetical protein QXY86_00810 [Candidatus Micrarchaeaceae archaeon]
MPYTIYFNTPQGISSSYTPQTTPYSEWQQYAQAQANQQFSPFNTYIAPILSELGFPTTTAQLNANLGNDVNWLNTNVVQPIESAYNTYVAPGITAAGQFLNANVVKPAEQFGQGVLNTPLSLQLPQTVLATQLLQPSTLQNNQMQNMGLSTSAQQPTTTIGSLLSSAGQTFNNALNKYVAQLINNYLSPY